MRRNGIILSVYSSAAVLYTVLSLVLTNDKNAVFWTGFGVTLFAFTAASAVTVISNRKRNPSPSVEISIAFFSAAYAAVSVAVDILLGSVLKAPVDIFVCIHIICFVLYAVITAFMFSVKRHILKETAHINGKICEMQVIIYEFEKIRTKLSDAQTDSRKKALSLMDALLDEMRFSDPGFSTDTAEFDTKLYSIAEMLSSEVDNLTDIDSDDFEGIEVMIRDAEKIVKDRNMQIKLAKDSI